MSREDESAKWIRKAMLVTQDSVYAEMQALMTGTAKKLKQYGPMIEHCSRARQHIQLKLKRIETEEPSK